MVFRFARIVQRNKELLNYSIVTVSLCLAICFEGAGPTLSVVFSIITNN
jgi:hypothetical protein